jgi:diacylglycerol kinase (ATP)
MLVTVNPTAGAGRARRLIPWLRERLDRRPDVELHVTVRRGDAETTAERAAADGVRRIVAVGGDGTVQEVLNGVLARTDPDDVELGIVPIGSGNDLARSLALPRDPAEAWRIAIGSTTRPIDVAHATNGEGRGRWFASAGGVGFDAQVAAAMDGRRGWQAGRAGYLLTTLVELRRFDNRRVSLQLDDGAPEEARVLLVAIANGAYYGGGMRIAPGARADDGLLDLCVVGDIGRLTAVRQLPNLYRGTHVDHPSVSMRTARTIQLDGDGAARIHLDGEPFGGLPLRVRIEPARIAVAVAVGG